MTLADKYVLVCDCFAPIPDLLWNDSLAPTLAEIKMARRRAGFAPWCGVGFFMRRSGNQLFPDIFSNHWLSYFRPARRWDGLVIGTGLNSPLRDSNAHRRVLVSSFCSFESCPRRRVANPSRIADMHQCSSRCAGGF